MGVERVSFLPPGGAVEADALRGVASSPGHVLTAHAHAQQLRALAETLAAKLCPGTQVQERPPADPGVG